jgi:hypothetical protein
VSTRTTATIWASRLGAVAVACVAGYASFRHITHVATMAGEPVMVARVYPAAIDGLIVVGTMAMIADKANGRHPRTSARFALGFGILATLAANIASAQPTITARLVAAVPAVSFLIAVEVIARQGKPKPADPVDSPDPALSTSPAAPDVEVVDNPELRVTKPRPTTAGAGKKKPTAERVAKAYAKNPTATAAQIAARLGLSERTVQRYAPAPAATVTTPVVPDTADELLELATV